MGYYDHQTGRYVAGDQRDEGRTLLKDTAKERFAALSGRPARPIEHATRNQLRPDPAARGPRELHRNTDLATHRAARQYAQLAQHGGADEISNALHLDRAANAVGDVDEDGTAVDNGKAASEFNAQAIDALATQVDDNAQEQGLNTV